MRWQDMTNEEKLALFNEAATYLDWADMIRALFEMADLNDDVDELRVAIHAELDKRPGK